MEGDHINLLSVMFNLISYYQFRQFTTPVGVKDDICRTLPLCTE